MTVGRGLNRKGAKDAKEMQREPVIDFLRIPFASFMVHIPFPSCGAGGAVDA